MHTRTHTRKHTYTSTRTHIHIYTCTHARVRRRTHTHVHTYTHIHTRIPTVSDDCSIFKRVAQVYIYIYISGLNEEVTLHPSSIPSHSFIPSHSYVSILVFLSKRSEVLLIFFVFLEISKMRNRMEINL